MRHVRVLLLGLLALAALVMGGGPTGAAPGTTERVSVDSAGTEGDGDSLGFHSISLDGRFVAFESVATNLVPDDTNGVQDVFIHDRQTGGTTKLSVSSTGAQGNGFSAQPDISADGRFVVFESAASNLVADDSNGARDIFVRDRLTGETSRVSVSSNGVQGNAQSWDPAISANGRYVAFASFGTNLVPGTVHANVFLRDRVSGITEVISVSSEGIEGGGYGVPDVSPDGRYVTFVSFASNLVANDTNSVQDVFVRDRLTGETSRVSVASDGTEGNDQSSARAAISDDGRFVVFQSLATNLVPNDTNGVVDVFVRDRLTGQTARVSISSGGAQGDSNSWAVHITADGRYVSFSSDARNLVPDDTGWSDVFVRDLAVGRTTRVSIASDGAEANGHSLGLAISGEGGRYVAFYSHASNLVPNDNNGLADVFVHDLGDTDGDGEWDPFDNCPDTANPGQENAVHPGTFTGDDCEDPEPDGVMDIVDNCPDTANPGQQNNVHPLTFAGDHCEDPEPDGVFDISDNCPDTANPGQQNNVHPGTPAGDACDNPDGDAWVDAADNCPDVGTPWFVPLDDNPDCDGFPRTTQQGMRGPESFIGTDPNLACGVNAWPVDNNDDHSVGLADMLRYIPVYLTVAGDGHYNPRYDLNADSKIGLADVLMFIPFYLTTCTP